VLLGGLTQQAIKSDGSSDDDGDRWENSCTAIAITSKRINPKQAASAALPCCDEWVSRAPATVAPTAFAMPIAPQAQTSPCNQVEPARHDSSVRMASKTDN